MVTAYKYLRYLGYRFDERKKSYYNDGHEKPEQIQYRKRFIAEYFENELSCYLWVQVNKATAVELENDPKSPLPKNISHEYVQEGREMREYHIDAHYSLKNHVHPTNREHGANLSIRKNSATRPVICVGEDESAFSQYAFSTKSWKGPNGEQKLLPKGEGETLMVAGFMSRQFGLGKHLTEEHLIAINRYRNERRRNYMADVEAIAVHGKSEKKDLIDNSPFIRFLEVGAEKEGFWNYNNMAIMTEDLVDCLQVLYPVHDIMLYFDQSSGHCRKRHDGLNIVGMNGDWGGAQQKMRDTRIIEGCLGPYPNRTLTVGDFQSLVFTEQDFGPVHMKKNQNRADRKYDREIGRKRKRKSKNQLMKELIETKGYNPTRQYTRKQIEQTATEFGMDLDEEVGEVLEGWIGKPKGMYQILWERGWIDATKRFSDYSNDGKTYEKDENGEIMPLYLPLCLRYLLSQCSDFKCEVTALEDLAARLSTASSTVRIKYTPKYHCEIAGEGIEYAWGLSKRFYRALPLTRKRGIANFRRSVRESVDAVTIENVRKFGGKVRRYMLAYLHYDNRSNEDSEDKKATYLETENFVKKTSKCHRSVADCEVGYLTKVLRESLHLPAIV
jgi:hypothetical protein